MTSNESPKSTKYVAADVQSTLKALEAEPKILIAEFGNVNQIWVQVKDDGTSRKGYAMYVCEVVRDNMVATGIQVRVNAAFSKEVVILGQAAC